MKRIGLGLIGSILVLAALAVPVFGQTEVVCDQTYTVTSGDWLSKLADKFYGNPKLYLAVATQTNLKSETDFSYATIVNPDVLDVGWKLCIPTKARANELTGTNPPPGLDRHALDNAAYTTAITNDRAVQLTNGKYTHRDDPNSPLMTEIITTDQIAYGTVNGVPSAAVITGSTGGGSGYFIDLHLMQVKDGKPVEVGVHSIGDRSPVIAAIFEGDQIKADFITQGPDQPFCCGTLRDVAMFAMQGNQLTVTSQNELGYLGPNGETPGQALAVTGNVIYRERIAMPPGAVVKVQVADVSLQDAPARVLGEQIINNPGNVPVPFAVKYNASDIQQGRTYAVAARIEVDGKLQWISTQRYPVITNGAPTSGIEVLVQQVGSSGSASTTPELTGTTWEWMGSTGKNGDVTAQDPSKYTVEFLPNGTAHIKADCNTGGADYVTREKSLKFLPITTTRMFCADSQDTVFLTQLQATVSYGFKQGNLFLITTDGTVMNFQPGQASATIPPGFTGITWKWQQTQSADGHTTAPKNPSKYTVEFNPDGTVNVRADCNSGGGSFTINGNALTFSPLIATEMACPEPSSGSEFMRDLQSTVKYHFDGNNLVLELENQTGLMTFSQ